MKKEVYLPYELIRANGRIVTEVYHDIQKKSLIRQGFYNHINEKINKSQEMIWNKFIQWLKLKRIKTINDFKPKKWLWQIINDKKYVKIENEN